MMRKEKLIQTILYWKIFYIIWMINFIIIFSLEWLLNPDSDYFGINLRYYSRYYHTEATLSELIFQGYWYALGGISIIIGCYWFYKKQWMNGMLYFCLFLIPSVVIELDYLYYNYILDYLL